MGGGVLVIPYRFVDDLEERFVENAPVPWELIQVTLVRLVESVNELEARIIQLERRGRVDDAN